MSRQKPTPILETVHDIVNNKPTELKNKLIEKYFEMVNTKNGRYTALSVKEIKAHNCYSIPGFVDKLELVKYFDNNDRSVDDMMEHLQKMNDSFFSSFGYSGKIKEDDRYFYSEEKKCIIKEVCMFFRRNNFIDYLNADLQKKQIKPTHDLRPIRKPISKIIRKQVWKNEYGNKISGCCPVAHCNNIIYFNDKDYDRNDVNNTSKYYVGHVVSVKNGGGSTAKNLRPICWNCNTRMSSMNWDDYEDIKLNIYMEKISDKECVCRCGKIIVLEDIDTYKTIVIEKKYVPICLECSHSFVVIK